MKTIRDVFTTRRPIDRKIEKVIDYSVADEVRLAAEVEEYEVTDNIERCFERFLDAYGAGVRTGVVTEIGIWVAGFYGSGKSSFTKYLGFALGAEKTVGGKPFLDLLSDRLSSAALRAGLQTLTKKEPTAVVMLDLGAEQLADNAAESVAKVLYWKVLQLAGYSREKKLAELERKLAEVGKLGAFQERYHAQFGVELDKDHNDPLVGVARAARIVPEFLPDEFPTEDAFRQMRFDEALDLRELTRRILDVVRKNTGKQNVLFLIDEAGQYVAPRGELILNLDGLARNLKELGKGKAWIACTGQQTLTEILTSSALNSAELNKLKDRFPIAINLEARDIREITYKRLLTKSAEGETALRSSFKEHGNSLVTQTRLQGTRLYSGDPDADTFVRLYPFLPQHFDLLLELIRSLARSTGGIGLRSAIRVVQDLLVDASRILGPGATRLADRSIGHLACVDDFYETLRADIAKVLPHVSAGVDRVAKVFAGEPLTVRVSKAVAALQPLENFPRTAENIAALLYREIGGSSLRDEVSDALRRLVADRECGLIEDPKSGGYQFLSEGVRNVRERRNEYAPPSIEINQLRASLVKAVLDPPPSARLEDVKEIKAGARLNGSPIVDSDAEIQFLIEAVAQEAFEQRRTSLLADTASRPELQNRIAWLVRFPEELDDLLVEICRSDWLLRSNPEREADRDIAQFLRAEAHLASTNRDRAKGLVVRALQDGTFVFRGRATTTTEAGETLPAATRTELKKAAEEIYGSFRLAPCRAATDLASKFLGVERLDRIPRELDPLHLVTTTGGRPRVDKDRDVLAEMLRVLDTKLQELGSGRIQGNAVQDLFAGPPYGWTKDTTRYLLAAALVAGQIEIHTAEGVVRTSGPKAQEAFKSTVAFNRVGIARRDTQIPPEALERAAGRLESIFGTEVIPLEDRIAATVRAKVPPLAESIGSLPDRLRLLGLAGEERSRTLLESLTALVQQDAGAAASILGAIDCALPGDIRWAEGIVTALKGGAEDEIKNAHRLAKGLEELTLIDAGEAGRLDAPAAIAPIREILASQDFQQRLGDLRLMLRSVADRVATRLDALRSEYVSARDRARAELEAMPEWPRLTDADRKDIVEQVSNHDLPERPVAGQELAHLQLVVVRRDQLAGKLDKLRAEVRRRVPAPPSPPPPPADEEVVELNALLPSDALKTDTELQVWLDRLKQSLTALLQAGKSIRLRVK